MDTQGLESLFPEGVEKTREPSQVVAGMSLKEGLAAMVRRSCMSLGRAREAARDRIPRKPPAHFRNYHRGARKFLPHWYVEFDVLFTDVLHSDHREMALLGIGRRYLVSRIMRTVLSGICDGLDPTRRAGDFPPKSWLDEKSAREVEEVQLAAERYMGRPGKGLFASVRVRLSRISTDVLRALSDAAPEIRSRVGRVSCMRPEDGLRTFSDMLPEFKRRFEKAKDPELVVKREYRKRKYRREKGSHLGGMRRTAKLQMAMTDLRKMLDPSIPCWYRRPTDPDWTEGRGHERRVPVTMRLGGMLGRWGMGGLPGITEPLRAEDWEGARFKWTADEARALFGSGPGGASAVPGKRDA